MNAQNENDPRALLPWAANATLTAVELQQVEALTAADREAADELNFLRRLAHEVKADTPDSIVSEFGWERLQRQLDAPATMPAATAKFSRLWQGVAIAAMLVIAVQVGWMANMQRDNVALNTQLLSGSRATPVDGQTHLRVMFESSATSLEIQRLLHSVGATVVSGPSPLGLYEIRVTTLSEEQQAALIDQLSASPVIRHVELVDHQ